MFTRNSSMQPSVPRDLLFTLTVFRVSRKLAFPVLLASNFSAVEMEDGRPIIKPKPLSSALSALAILLLFFWSASLIFAQSENGPRQTPSKSVRNEANEKPQSQNQKAVKPDAAKTARQETKNREKTQPPGEKTKAPVKPETHDAPKDKAWGILHDGIEDKSAERRAKAVRALGLLPDNQVAEAVADKALKDDKSMVRAAAAEALGSMSARHSIRDLRAVLDDTDPQVVLAAANSLMELADTGPAYNIYYGLLTGRMRGDKGFVKEQVKTMQDPKKLATLGFEEGIGFVPFAGIGYSVYKRVIKSDSGDLRAAVAKRLALDPDPLSARALVAATQDKHWLVRAAALEAISQRGDRALLPKVILSLDDEKDEVRFAAAACIVHLSDLPAKSGPTASTRK